MNGFDLALLLFAGILALVGLSKGLLRILVGMLALIAAFVLAARFHEPLAQQIAGLELPAGALRLIAYVSIFMLVLLAGGLASFYGRRAIRAAMLGWLDRSARLLGQEIPSTAALPHLCYGFTLDTTRAERELAFRPSHRIGLARAGDGTSTVETASV